MTLVTLMTLILIPFAMCVNWGAPPYARGYPFRTFLGYHSVGHCMVTKGI